jgi:hypothetical protein
VACPGPGRRRAAQHPTSGAARAVPGRKPRPHADLHRAKGGPSKPQGCRSRRCRTSDAALAAWHTFVTDAVGRSGTGGQFWAENPGLTQNPIEVWQIWNEQNSATFDEPKPSPKAYAKLLDVSANAIRGRDPGADVILGGMAGLIGVKKAVTAWNYLAKLYKRKGVKKDFDGVAPHPYGQRLKKFQLQIDRTRATMKQASDAGTGLWITEIGWGSQ